MNYIGSCSKPGQYLIDKTDCTVFYECDPALIARQFQCDDGLCFSPEVNMCEFFNSGYCSRC